MFIRQSLPIIFCSLLALLANPALTAPSPAPAPAPAQDRALEGRAAYNPFHPDNLRLAAIHGQQAQIRREAGHALQARSKGKRMMRKRKECSVKTTSISVLPGSSSSVVSPVATSTGKAEEGQVTIPVPVPVTSTSISSSLPVQNAPVIPKTTTSTTASSTPKPTRASSSTPSSAAAPAPTTSKSTSPAFTSKDYEGNGPFDGESTYYVLGTDGNAVGACGNKLVDSDLIAAASEYLFDSWPGANGNPNQNPICGQYAKVSYQGKSVVVRIEDRCPGCEKRHLDLSPSAFTQLADTSVGLMDVTWEWVGSASG